MSTQFFDNWERHFQYSLFQTPLWKQSWQNFYQSSEFTVNSRLLSCSNKDDYNEEQDILAHIVKQRQKEGLPPFFALLSGPTFLKFRMEALSVILGRNTATCRDADISLSDNKLISRRHVLIEFDREKHHYIAKVLGKNPIFLIHQDGSKTQLTRDTSPIVLRNPTVFDIQGVIVFFQIFYITDGKCVPLRAADVIVHESHSSQFSQSATSKSNQFDFHFQTEKSKSEEFDKEKEREHLESSDVTSQSSLSHSRKTGNRQGKKDGVSYAMMIETAINAKGGRARYSDIISYIEEHFKDVISTRRTWKNSIGGVLSSNEKFIPEVDTSLSSLSNKRNRGSWWRMRTPDDPPPITGPGVSTSAAKKRQRQLQFQQAQEHKITKRRNQNNENVKEKNEDEMEDESLLIDEDVSQPPQKKQKTQN